MARERVFRLLGALFVFASVLGRTAGFRICLVQNVGFANCSIGAPPSTYTGMDLELIRIVAKGANWTEVPDGVEDTYDVASRRFSFVCTSRRVAATIQVLINDSSASFEECAMASGAFTVTEQRVQAGARFSWPYLRTGLGVLISTAAPRSVYDRWAFLRPFDNSVWAALLATIFTVPMVLFVVENMMQTGRLPVGMSMLHQWRHATYAMFLCCFNLEVLSVVSLPSQLLIVCFAFSNLILISSYTANLAAVLTAAASQTGIQSIEDLPGLPVSAHGIYVDRLANNEKLLTTPLNWAGQATFEQVSKMLQSGSLSAYIFDKPILQYWLTQDKSCSLGLTPDEGVMPFDYGMAFHRHFPADMLFDFNLGVLNAQSLNLLNGLQEKYLGHIARTACPATAVYNNSLKFGQISGLWVILGCVAGLCFLACCWAVWHHHCHKQPSPLPSPPPPPLPHHLNPQPPSPDSCNHNADWQPSWSGPPHPPTPADPAPSRFKSLLYHRHHVQPVQDTVSGWPGPPGPPLVHLTAGKAASGKLPVPNPFQLLNTPVTSKTKADEAEEQPGGALGNAVGGNGDGGCCGGHDSSSLDDPGRREAEKPGGVGVGESPPPPRCAGTHHELAPASLTLLPNATASGPAQPLPPAVVLANSAGYGPNPGHGVDAPHQQAQLLQLLGQLGQQVSDWQAAVLQVVPPHIQATYSSGPGPDNTEPARSSPGWHSPFGVTGPPFTAANPCYTGEGGQKEDQRQPQPLEQGQGQGQGRVSAAPSYPEGPLSGPHWSQAPPPASFHSCPGGSPPLPQPHCSPTAGSVRGEELGGALQGSPEGEGPAAPETGKAAPRQLSGSGRWSVTRSALTLATKARSLAAKVFVHEDELHQELSQPVSSPPPPPSFRPPAATSTRAASLPTADWVPSSTWAERVSHGRSSAFVPTLLPHSSTMPSSMAGAEGSSVRAGAVMGGSVRAGTVYFSQGPGSAGGQGGPQRAASGREERARAGGLALVVRPVAEGGDTAQAKSEEV